MRHGTAPPHVPDHPLSLIVAAISMAQDKGNTIVLTSTGKGGRTVGGKLPQLEPASLARIQHHIGGDACSKRLIKSQAEKKNKFLPPGDG